MLFTLAALLFAVWVAAVLTSTLFGGFVHLLLVLSVGAVIVRLIQAKHSR